MALAIATPMARKPSKSSKPKTEKVSVAHKTCTIRVRQSVADLLELVQNLSHHRKVDLASEILETELKKRMPKIAEELRKQADQLEGLN